MKRRTIFKMMGGAGAVTLLAACGGGTGTAARILTVGLPNGALTETTTPSCPIPRPTNSGTVGLFTNRWRRST